MDNTYIYGLRDPRDGRIRYVGRTRDFFARRLRAHCTVRSSKHLNRRRNWIESLRRLGLRPQIECLEVVPGNGFEEEIRWIAKFREFGHDLVNTLSGGAGMSRSTANQRAKLSEYWKAKGFNIGLQRSAALRRGKKQSVDHVERKIASCREHWITSPRRTPEKNCLECGTIFKNSHSRRGKFCSRQCANRHAGAEKIKANRRTCEFCSKEFSPSRSVIRFCSKACANRFNSVR
jgi:GIY-YIG catalytic domain